VACGENDRCLHVALPVAAFLGNAYQACHYKSNDFCLRRRGSRDAAEDDPRHSILQLNTQGLTASTIIVIEQLV